MCWKYVPEYWQSYMNYEGKCRKHYYPEGEMCKPLPNWVGAEERMNDSAKVLLLTVSTLILAFFF